MTQVKTYELMVILDPEQTNKDQEKTIQEIRNYIASKKGTIQEEEAWGIRQLAYRIKHHDQGYYLLITYDFPGAELKDFDAFLLLEKGVLRHLNTAIPRNYKKIEYQTIVADEEKQIEELKQKKAGKKNEPTRTPASKTTENKAEKPKESAKLNEKLEKLTAVDTETEKTKAAKKSSGVDENFDKKLENIIKGDDLDI